MSVESEEKRKKANEAYAKWYKNNKEDFNAARRKRYKEDESYRKTTLEQSKKFKTKKHDVVHIEGRDYYRIGYALEVLKTTSSKLQKWEKEGILPEPFKDKKGYRHYTQKQIGLLVDQFKAYREGEQSDFDEAIETTNQEWND